MKRKSITDLIFLSVINRISFIETVSGTREDNYQNSWDDSVFLGEIFVERKENALCLISY